MTNVIKGFAVFITVSMHRAARIRRYDAKSGIAEREVRSLSKHHRCTERWGFYRKIISASRKFPRDLVPAEVIVKFKQSRVDLKNAAGVSRSAQFASRQNLSFKENVRRANLSVLKTRGAESTEQAIARLKTDPDVEYVEPNYRRYRSDNAETSISSNDFSRGQLWALENTGQTINGTSVSGGVVAGTVDADIDAADAWPISEGAGVVVAVIDSGVAYYHPDLTANMWDGSTCVDENGAPLGGCDHGYDFDDNDKTPLPTTSSHGTHVAGIIAASMNNSIGTIGVAPKAKIMALKFDYTVASEVRAIDFAIQNGAKVINASFVGDTFSQAELDAIKRFRDAGGIFIAAAGNDGADSDITPSYPADHALDNIISVAATDQNDLLASFSNYGDVSVDIGAPGVNILSTIADHTLYSENFSSVSAPALPGGWTKTGNWGTYNFPAPIDNVLYADLAYPYANNANTSATSPSIDLNGASAATVTFLTKCDTEYVTTGWADYMQLKFSSDGSTFAPVPLPTDSLGRFDEARLDMLNGDSDPSGGAAYAFSDVPLPGPFSANSKIQFDWTTNGSVNEFDGCFIDFISVKKMTNGSDGLYDYLQGTSMAAPHVAGVAAQMYALRPDFTATQIKAAILDNGDANSSLAGKTVTGKRLNAFATLSASNNGNTVPVIDTTPPVITLMGSTSMDLVVGDVFTDPGFTASDNIDGDLTAHVVVGGEIVATSTPGAYTITYNVSDAALNAAEQKTRVVHVSDIGAPIFSGVPKDQTIEATSSAGATLNYALPTATDAIDGDVTVTCAPVSGTMLAVGTHTVSCSAADTSGNEASASFTVTVTILDNTPPKITLVGDSTMDLAFGDLFTDPGATASDDTDGDLTDEIVVTGTVNPTLSGTYTLRYNVSDSHGNAATEVTRTVIIDPFEDTLPPVTAPEPPPTPSPAPPSGGGGGGDGGIVYTYSVSINNGATEATSSNVTLTISPAANANQMQIWNDLDLTTPEWLPFESTYPWTLTPGSGTKTVFVRYGSGGQVVGNAYDSIDLVEGKVVPISNLTQAQIHTPMQAQVLGASAYNFTKTLKRGSSGAEVTELQRILIEAGYLKIDVTTGYFGTMTEAALKDFQKAHDLDPVGYTGPKTRALLNQGITPTTTSVRSDSPQEAPMTETQRRPSSQQLHARLNIILEKIAALTGSSPTLIQ